MSDTSDNPAGGQSGALPGPLAAGTVLQRRYAIERLLGGGGMGMVYLAHDQRLANRPCAIKEMVDHFIDPRQRIEANEYFAREADTLAQLKHPAIPAISDRFDDQNRHYLVMEYVEGRNLEEELAARGGPFPESLVVDVARQLCDVLAYLHGLQPPIIYRDMKPSNVMLTGKGRVVLIDFGIARLFKGSRKGTMIGTLGFAPPEQYQGVADPRSDIYSLGATLHYVLTGRDPENYPPFSFPPVRDLRPETSRNVAGAIDRALAYEMDHRPATIQEFRDMLLYGAGLTADGSGRVSARGGTADLSEAIAPSRPQPKTARRASTIRPRPRKGRWIGLAVFCVITAGAAFGATYVYRNPALQQQLGLSQFINNLPWKREERMAYAQANPLTFQNASLELSTRAGDAISRPRLTFTDTELANAQYLRWEAAFKNNMAGLNGVNDRVEARIFDPNGNQIASSADSRFVGPGETNASFSGVALIPNAAPIASGSYKIAFYSNDQQLGQQMFQVNPDLAARAAAAKAAAEAAAAAKAAEDKRKQDAEKLAMLEERMKRPLSLQSIEFVNSTKDGTPLSRPSSVFAVSKVLFVGWKVSFKNRLYGLDNNQYRVDAAYIAPDGSMLGSVDDIRTISKSSGEAIFTGRVGNSAGGAFLPGKYTVNFYLNGQYFAQRTFRVVADAGSPYAGGGGGGGGGGGSFGAGGGGGATSASLETPTLASGTIDGIAGRGGVPMELRLRPQPNGFLHGELVVHLNGYGLTPIEGFVRGDRLQFQVPYGSETYYFEGQLHGDVLSGTYQSTPTGNHGAWTTHTD
jgi:serine/threonine protein kinase